MNSRPKLAVFPKAYMEPLCKTGEMKLAEWIDLAGELPIDGLEFYCGILDLADSREWKTYRKMVEEKGCPSRPYIPLLHWSGEDNGVPQTHCVIYRSQWKPSQKQKR